MLFHCIVTINQQFVWLRIQSSMHKPSTWSALSLRQEKKSLTRWSWLWYIKMDDQVVDLFTKSMSTRKFESVCCQLSIIKKMKAGIEGECWNILHQPMETSIVSLKVFSRVKLVGSKQRSGLRVWWGIIFVNKFAYCVR